MSTESPRIEFGERLSGKKPAAIVLLGIIVLLAAACGGLASDDSSNDPDKREASRQAWANLGDRPRACKT